MATLDDVNRNLFELTNQVKRNNELLRQLMQRIAPDIQPRKDPGPKR